MTELPGHLGLYREILILLKVLLNLRLAHGEFRPMWPYEPDRYWPMQFCDPALAEFRRRPTTPLFKIVVLSFYLETP